jgi:rRNA-processing protein FCF1
MKILMDSDCLIKLAKAGIKENICQHFKITIPAIVKKEVVDAGKIKGLPDANRMEENINKDIIRVAGKESLIRLKGDQALIEFFKRGKYDAIASDDAKLIRILRLTGIRFILPGLLIYLIFQKNIIDKETALNWLEKLSPFISEDEYSVIKFLLEGKS